MADDIAERVKKIIIEQLEVSPDKVKPEASFAEDLKADSLAVVARPNASDPEPGSLIPCAPMMVPSHSPGRYRCFWASVPKRTIGVSQAHICALSEKIRLLSAEP